MFLNKTMLKKLIKGSFNKEGLFVGKIYGGLVVAGGNWITWTQEGYVPNWLLAAVMEYTGELPGNEKAFKAKKSEPIQYEVADNEVYDLPDMKRKCKVAFTVTPIMIEHGYAATVRLLQQVGTNEMRAMSEDYYKVIDLSEMEGENTPSGPAAVTESADILVWKNEFSAYAFAGFSGVRDEVRGIMSAVSLIDFGKENH